MVEEWMHMKKSVLRFELLRKSEVLFSVPFYNFLRHSIFGNIKIDLFYLYFDCHVLYVFERLSGLDYLKTIKKCLNC